MSKMTIYKLAKELNMTPSMISRAFSPNGKVSDEKRKLILETAKKYDFMPNKMASRLSMRSISIGIVINSSFSINAEKMIRGIEESYEELKDYKITYDVEVINLSDTNENCDHIFAKYAGYDGIIVAGFSAEKYTQHLNELYRKNPNIVQVQAINEGANCLFASKHSEKTASAIASEFLYNCLSKSKSKNILLFIGDRESLLHKRAKEAFEKACGELNLNILDVIDAKNRDNVRSAFKKYEGKIDGIYTTSGFSTHICEYLEESSSDISFVAFDTHEKVKEYMQKGIISATISQDITKQMKNAFEHLVKYIINDEKPSDVIYTDVQLVLKSNMHLFN